MRRIRNFLLFCSGATIPIILRDACITEHDKYASIGAIILLTAILAVFSGGYALYTIFRSLILSSIFGLFWGLLIFTLDRYFVLSIKKGKDRSKIQQFATVAPRIVLAFIISIVIAKPLELKIFEPEIKAKNQEDINNDYNKEVKDRNSIYNLNKNRLSDEINKLENDLDYAHKLTRDFSNFGKESAHITDDKIYQKRLDKDEEYEQNINNEINQKNQELKQCVENLKCGEENLKEFRDKARASHPDSLLTQLTILRQLESDKKDSTKHYISLFITCLFIVIETSPILGKLFSEPGAYDLFVKAEEEIAAKIKDEYKKYRIDNERSVLNAQKAVLKNKLKTEKEIAEEIKDEYKKYRIENERSELQAQLNDNKVIRENFSNMLNAQTAVLKNKLQTSEDMKNALDRIVTDLAATIEKKLKFSNPKTSEDMKNTLDRGIDAMIDYLDNSNPRNTNTEPKANENSSSSSYPEEV